MRVVIADNEARIRSGLVVVAREMNVSVIAEVSQVEALLDYVSHSLPDVVLLSWELPGLLPEIHLPALRLFGLGCKIIVLSKNDREHYRAMTAGADYFMSTNNAPYCLSDAIYSVYALPLKSQRELLLTT
jgi:DNA-binding NarL/FixJ family response regulator